MQRRPRGDDISLANWISSRQIHRPTCLLSLAYLVAIFVRSHTHWHFFAIVENGLVAHRNQWCMWGGGSHCNRGGKGGWISRRLVRDGRRPWHRRDGRGWKSCGDGLVLLGLLLSSARPSRSILQVLGRRCWYRLGFEMRMVRQGRGERYMRR